MKLTEDIIEKYELQEEVVKAIEEVGATEIANVKKEFEGKANENAQKIIEGAANMTVQKFGVEIEREQGEKLGDYLARISEKVVSGKQGEIDQLKSEYEEKIKNVKGADNIKAEYDKLKGEIDEVKKKYADYDQLKENAEKYQTVSEELKGLKLTTAFDNVKPTFPETVNEYEANAKWNAFKNSVLKEYKIELVEGKPIAISKENEYVSKELGELLKANEPIQELLEGRKQGGIKGSGAVQKDLIDVEGVPFKVKKDASSAERTEAIREHLEKKGLNKTSGEYAKEFAELNKKILAG